MLAGILRNLVTARHLFRSAIPTFVHSFYRCDQSLIGIGVFSKRAYKMLSLARLPPKFIKHPTELAIIAASSAVGQVKPGVESAPRALLSSILPELLEQSLGLTLRGHTKAGDCPTLHNSEDINKSVAERAKEVANITREISISAHDHAKSGRLVLTLGGDHSIAIGSVSGIAKAVSERSGDKQELGVIWVDAHADINTPQTSGSGNIHGQPLAFLSELVRPSGDDAFGWIREEHRIRLEKLVYIGIRDIDETERKVIRDHGIKAYTPFDVTHLGIRTVMHEILDHLGADTPIHLGFDIDGLDPSVAPSTGLPVPGGLTLREGQYICERLSRSGQLVAMDMVEINPQIGTKLDVEKTLQAATSVIYAGLGGSVI